MPFAFVYMLRCADGSLYTGYTVDLQRRLGQHQRGRGGRYTRTHRPVELVYSERFRTRAAAMRREALIKTYSRSRKLGLIASNPHAQAPIAQSNRKRPARVRRSKSRRARRAD